MTTLQYRDLPDVLYQDVPSSEFDSTDIIAMNLPLAETLGLSAEWLQSDDGQAVMSGQNATGGGPGLAMAYGGHQFGSWSGSLGDGRARLVGDLPDEAGRRHELHLKGAGRTPYSRRGDGKATLGSAIREYIVSEAMAALGVPTTRSLSVVTTGETILRNGPEPAAILCRTARSHIRVGTFQIAAASGEIETVKALADFAIDRLYADAPADGPKRYQYFLEQVIKGQASLISKWMGYGFIHGVMNTDNACISGETIDYGPCAFMDEFHPGKVFSSIDRNGRYAWNRQPEIGHWNMTRLAETILPLLGETEDVQQAAAQSALATFTDVFSAQFHRVMAHKLGLREGTDLTPDFLAKTFDATMSGQVDFTLFFRNLTRVASGEDAGILTALFQDEARGTAWIELWQSVTNFNGNLDAAQIARMRRSNPIIIARNHRVEAAIADANVGNFVTFETLLQAVTSPFQDRPAFKDFETPPKPEEIVRQTFCGT